MKPKYTREQDNLKVVVYDDYGGFDFDSFYIFDPSESESGAWEVWYTEWSDGDAKSGNVVRKMIEIHSDWVTNTQHVHLVCQSLAMGYDDGEQAGIKQMRACAKYALTVLTREADISDLYEAAYQHGFVKGD